MLVLRRKEGQWIKIIHKSGDTLRLKVYNIQPRFPGQLDIAFDDAARDFTIQRTEQRADDFPVEEASSPYTPR